MTHALESGEQDDVVTIVQHSPCQYLLSDFRQTLFEMSKGDRLYRAPITYQVKVAVEQRQKDSQYNLPTALRITSADTPLSCRKPNFSASLLSAGDMSGLRLRRLERIHDPSTQSRAQPFQCDRPFLLLLLRVVAILQNDARAHFA